MGNVETGSGNISKKIGYSITDEQLEKISAKAVGILDTVSGNKAERNLSNVLNKDFKAKAEAADVNSKAFLINIQRLSDGTITADKEIDEILTAVKAKKQVCAIYHDKIETTIIPNKLPPAGEIRLPLVYDCYSSQGYLVFGAMIEDLIVSLIFIGSGLNQWFLTTTILPSVSEADNIFVIHATLTSETTATTEESYDEVKEAITAEKQIVISLGGLLFTAQISYLSNVNNCISIVYGNLYCTYEAIMTPDGTVTFSTIEKVFSVNGRSGEVNLTASDVGAYTTGEADSAISGAVDTNIGILRSDVYQWLSVKADKTTLFTWGTSGIENFVLENNQEAMFFADMAVMVLAMPETINDLYHSNFSFSSGEEPTTLTYSATPIIWVGDDCDADGIFVPEANTRYEVSVKKLGDDIVARVGAY